MSGSLFNVLFYLFSYHAGAVSAKLSVPPTKRFGGMVFAISLRNPARLVRHNMLRFRYYAQFRKPVRFFVAYYGNRRDYHFGTA